MKKRIVTAVITACLALCAAVWPQPDTREERPAPIPTHAAAAPKADAAATAEKKNTETPQPEPAPPTPQPTIELQPGDEVYIPGFGWVPYEGGITASMPRICTKMATKSASWAETESAGSGYAACIRKLLHRKVVGIIL